MTTLSKNQLILELFKKVLVVTNNINHLKKKKIHNSVRVIKGGKERSDSSLMALKYLKKYKPNNILIHDAARPDFTIKLLKKLLNLFKRRIIAVVPYINSRRYNKI